MGQQELRARRVSVLALEKAQVAQGIRTAIAGLSDVDRAVCNHLAAQIRVIASSQTGMLALALVGAEMAAQE